MNRSTFFLPLLLSLAAAAAAPLSAQPPLPSPDMESIGGRVFYISFPDTVGNVQDPRFASDYAEYMELWIYSVDGQRGTISMGRRSREIELGANTFTLVDLKEMGNPMIRQSNRPDTSVVRLVTPSPVVVYASITSHFGSAAFTPVPVDRWGRDYVLESWPGTDVRNVYPRNARQFDINEKAPAPAEFLVIAAEDSTVVDVIPSGELAPCDNCTHFMLMAGEGRLIESAVHLEGTGEAEPDIAGTRLHASHPVGVVSGNTRLSIGRPEELWISGNGLKDLALEWVPPLSRAGSTFVFMPTMDDHNPLTADEGLRQQEFARVLQKGESEASIPAEVSDYQFDDLSEGHLLRADGGGIAFQSPERISQFNFGSTGEAFLQAEFFTWGSYLVDIVPREFWGSFAPIRTMTLSPRVGDHYVNIVTDTASAHNIVIDDGTGTPRPIVFDRQIVGAGDLLWTSLKLKIPGEAFIYGLNGARFGGFVYGEMRGREYFRANGDSTQSTPLVEYQETIGQMYAYPFPSLLLPDSAATVTRSAGTTDGLSITGLDPTPAHDQIILRFRVDRQQQIRIDLLDLRGRHLRTLDDQIAHLGEHQRLVDLRDLPTGLYFLRIAGEGGEEIRTISLVH